MKELIKHTERQAQSDEAGFTLLEAAISMVLLAIVGLGLASIFFVVTKTNVSARDRELAMAVAQQQMEQMQNVSFNHANLADTATAGVSAGVTRAGRRYVVLTRITDSNFIDGTARTKTITVRVTPWSDGSSWARTVSSVFGSVTMVSQRSAPTVGPNRAL